MERYVVVSNSEYLGTMVEQILETDCRGAMSIV